MALALMASREFGLSKDKDELHLAKLGYASVLFRGFDSFMVRAPLR